MQKNKIIVVDLDKSLIKIDIFLECLGRSFVSAPIIFFKTIFILLFRRSISESKTFIAQNFNINIDIIPFNENVISYLKTCKENGIKIVLSSGASEIHVSKIAKKLGLFDHFHGTTKTFNNIGTNKLNLLLNNYGGNFIYLGDSKNDHVIWKRCKSAIVVGKYGKQLVKDDITIVKTFNNNSMILRSALKQMRLHQWTKNLLIFVPSILSYHLFKSDVFFFNLNIFFSFSLIASSMYILNDINDIDNDRDHYDKKERPIASGNLSITNAYLLFIILFSLGIITSLITSLDFLYLILIYIFLNFFYSLILKEIFLIDVLILTTFYCLRILSGSIQETVPFSLWLMAFTLFIFFNLSLIKRFIDLVDLKNNLLDKISGRVYKIKDIKIIQILGHISSLLAFLTLTFYILSDQVLKIYESSLLLFFIIPILIFWNMRIWFLASKGILNSDPVIYVLKDKTSYITGLIVVITLFLARNINF